MAFKISSDTAISNSLAGTGRSFGRKGKATLTSANKYTIDCSSGNFFGVLDSTLKDSLTFTRVIFNNVPTTGTLYECYILFKNVLANEQSSLEFYESDDTTQLNILWGGSWQGSGTAPLGPGGYVSSGSVEDRTSGHSFDVFKFSTIDGGTTWYGSRLIYNG